MNIKMDKMCIICLNKGSQHEEVENILRDLLDALLISLDTTGSQKSIVCKECVAQIYELFDFKTLCLYTEDALFPFIKETAGKEAQLDLRSVYSKIKLRQFLKSKQKAYICRLCLEITTQWVSLETAISQSSIRDVFERNLPEISLQAVKRSCICENCLKMLDKLHSFASQCESNANSNRFENQFEYEFENECKIEIVEYPIDCVEDDFKGFVQHIDYSDQLIKEENGNLSSETTESDPRSTASHNTLETHRPLEDSKKPILCDSCPNVYYNHVDLALHSINHSENGMYNCHVCKNFSNVDSNSIVSHIRAHELLSIKTRYCAVCGQAFDAESIMMEHIEREHGRNICTYCGKKFSKKSDLKPHLRIHTGEKPHICTYCEKAFSRKKNLKYHLLTHAAKKPHICSTCGKGFPMNNSLKRHLLTHTGDKYYICPTCGKGFTDNTALKRHLRTHTGEKPHICSICGKGFAKKTDMDNHFLIHTGAKPHKPHICSTCGKGFSNTSNLNSHLRTHTGEKPHICSNCGKGFAVRANLKQHLRTHTGEKPHNCSICGKGFSHKSHLNIHLRVHTGEKPHICLTCGKGFSQKCHLNNHLLIHT